MTRTPSLKKTSKSKAKPRVIVMSGYGLNCEEETKYAFEWAGGMADIVHINDLIDGRKKLKDYQILAVPGGFSYGDDTGSGKAYANKMKNHLMDDLEKFIERDTLMIGICNGFQVLTSAGLLPGALTYNESARYIDRWVDLKIENQNSPWLTGITRLSVPIAHGEGKYMYDAKIKKILDQENGVAFRYVKGEMCTYQDLPANPNGATDDIAGVTAKNGRILGMMPHPERAMFSHQLPNFPLEKEKAKRAGKEISEEGPGLQIFRNAIKYFQ